MDLIFKYVLFLTAVSGIAVASLRVSRWLNHWQNSGFAAFAFLAFGFIIGSDLQQQGREHYGDILALASCIPLGIWIAVSARDKWRM